MITGSSFGIFFEAMKLRMISNWRLRTERSLGPASACVCEPKVRRSPVQEARAGPRVSRHVTGSLAHGLKARGSSPVKQGKRLDVASCPAEQ
jgi:hypothetical protein